MTSPAYPLHQASLIGAAFDLEGLVKSGHNVNGLDDNGWAPMHWAATGNDLDTIKELVRLGGNVNLKNKEQWIPIHYACQNGRIEILNYLIEQGTDLAMDGGIIMVELEELAADDTTKRWVQYIKTNWGKKKTGQGSTQSSGLSDRERRAQERLKQLQSAENPKPTVIKIGSTLIKLPPPSNPELVKGTSLEGYKPLVIHHRSSPFSIVFHQS
eukprot:TRINITY_DN3315_c0_g1_i3.p1 TRINITY_DN3315_c0_g1~~TRINITY_DN3315_c0_g1_i3.p1  ORF type:complete len:213 (+),score=46.33 TRINITY_DN3315_c0_g1_i3:5-643(+)